MTGLSVLRGVVLILSALVGADAWSQAAGNLLFNGGGQSLSLYTSSVGQRAIVGAPTWTAGASGYVASASSPANGYLFSQSGRAVQLSGTALTRVAANDLAASAIGGIRAGLPGLLLSVAVVAALNAAHLAWDSTQQSMIYNPPPTSTPNPNGVGWLNFDSNGTSSSPEAAICHSAYRQSAGCHASGAMTIVQVAPGQWRASGNFVLASTGQMFSESVSGNGTGGQDFSCPNGITYGGPAGCAEPVTDNAAGITLGTVFTPQNAPAIGGAITGAGGKVQGSELPNVVLNPSPGPLTTTTNPDGSQTKVQTTYTPNCVANACTVTKTQTTTNLAPNGNPIGNPTTTTTTPAPAPNPTTDPNAPTDPNAAPAKNPDTPAITCGLPSTPPCKIDETGTPNSDAAAGSANAAKTAVAQTQTDATNQITASADPSTKNASWTFTFAFPTSCTSLTLWEGMTVAPCQVAGPFFLDIMTMVWWITGFFAVYTMWSRAFLGGSS